jgi:hypothetical protein
MKYFIEKLISRQDLSDDEMGSAFDDIMSGRANDTLIGAFLVALRAKGEKPSEIASAARIMRAKALRVEVDFDVVDTCGTGGDSASTLTSRLQWHLSWPVRGSRWRSTGTGRSAPVREAQTASKPLASPSTSTRSRQQALSEREDLPSCSRRDTIRA